MSNPFARSRSSASEYRYPRERGLDPDELLRGPAELLQLLRPARGDVGDDGGDHAFDEPLEPIEVAPGELDLEVEVLGQVAGRAGLFGPERRGQRVDPLVRDEERLEVQLGGLGQVPRSSEVVELERFGAPFGRVPGEDRGRRLEDLLGVEEPTKRREELRLDAERRDVLVRADDEVALVEPELLGLVAEDRERLAGVDDVDRRRADLAAAGRPRVRVDRSGELDRSLDLEGRRRLERLGPEGVPLRGDLDRAGPVPNHQEEEAAGVAGLLDPTSQPDGRTGRGVGEHRGDGVERRGASYWYSRHL